MMVVFVSQCEKQALKKSRRVLDAFANRLGDRTWQTEITQEGLKAVKKLLRKTASKNTAVACHYLHRNRRELLWIVGQQHKFNHEGYAPVNTGQAPASSPWETNWEFMPLIQALTALAALFHDWGKATQCFQAKLKPRKKGEKNLGDPLRHEWISCLLLHLFIHADDTWESDIYWLSRLEQGDIDEARLKQNINENIKKPLADLPPAAGLIAWLILTHHRLPQDHSENQSEFKGQTLSYQQLLSRMEAHLGYQNRFDERDYQARLNMCFRFPQGLLSESSPWLHQLKKWAKRLKSQLSALEKSIADGTFRLILHHCRLSLMLGDHHFSSQDKDSSWQSPIQLIANTERKTGQPKQYLDQHLVGVAESALRISRLLPQFENLQEDTPSLAVVNRVQALRKKSPPSFRWQDKAVEKIKSWRTDLPESSPIQQTGFFGINLASTGCGKTIANAKIMRALSPDYDSLRYILALGLRTLTLQTGDEYRERIGLDASEMGVLIGSRAIQELHQLQRQNRLAQTERDSPESLGSESLESLIDEVVHYESAISETHLTTLFQGNSKANPFLYAPILVCTIDHIMAATETKRGGRYILPCLRLMSSDLVIDEIDDFEGKDLIAIGRLIHLAGMLGRKVLLSSATIPPDLAEGYFHTYSTGWHLYAKARGLSQRIGCAWSDEFKTQVKSVDISQPTAANSNYQNIHDRFIQKRIKQLIDPNKSPIRRKGLIVECEHFKAKQEVKGQAEKDSLKKQYFSCIQRALIERHKDYHTVDHATQKKVSFGVVRLANIQPCIDLGDYLLHADWPADIAPKILVYHSQQVLLLRSEQEAHLDQILRRKESETEMPAAFSNPVIRQHIDESSAEHIVFVLVATPVEEVGRDHDLDWAIIEPSSFRSIIQLAGRVMRHRSWKTIIQPNIALLQYNLKALQGKNIAYTRPGYECKSFFAHANNPFSLSTHDLNTLLEGTDYSERIYAGPRIKKNTELLTKERLADLEHGRLADLLTHYNKTGPESLEGWLSQSWWLTAIPQQINPFRQSQDNLQLYYVWEDGDLCFKQKDKFGEWQDYEKSEGISKIEPSLEPELQARLWLVRDYQTTLEKYQEYFNQWGERPSLKQLSQKYGEINLPIYKQSPGNYLYSDQWGISKNLSL